MFIIGWIFEIKFLVCLLRFYFIEEVQLNKESIQMSLGMNNNHKKGTIIVVLMVALVAFLHFVLIPIWLYFL